MTQVGPCNRKGPRKRKAGGPVRERLENAKMLALRWRTGHELRKAGGLQKLEEARKWIGPQSLWKGGRPADPFQTSALWNDNKIQWGCFQPLN